MTTLRPRVLCTADLACAPRAEAILRESVDLDLMPYDRERLLAVIGNYDAYWCHFDRKVDKEILERGVRLKAVNTATTGTDHIDKAECAKRNIRVLCTAKDIGLLRQFTATAECGWMLLLNCMRHFRGATRSALEGKWNHDPFIGRQLFGRTLGILGLGRLGTMTAGFGRGFRMKILGCDRRDITLPDVTNVDFDTLLAESDALCIHVHMTPENYHLFNRQTFAKMKPGSVLINTSRGDIIDEQALIEALDSGRLAAFGADVLHDEWRPDMRESPVVAYAQTHDNVNITPHLGGATIDTVAISREFSARKLVQFLLTGEELHMP